MNRLKVLFVNSILLLITSSSIISVSYTEEINQAPPPLTPFFQAPVTEKELPVEEKTTLELRVENNAVYLRADRANLRELLKRLGEQAGFEVSMSPSSTVLSTFIEGLSIEDTIHRIMNIVQEKNYNIYYNEKGAIKKLEIFKETEQAPGRPAISPPQRPSPQMPRLQRPQIPRTPPAQVTPAPDETPPPPVLHENEDE